MIIVTHLDTSLFIHDVKVCVCTYIGISVCKCDLICVARSIEKRSDRRYLKGVPKRNVHGNILMMTVRKSMHTPSIFYVQP